MNFSRGDLRVDGDLRLIRDDDADADSILSRFIGLSQFEILFLVNIIFIEYYLRKYKFNCFFFVYFYNTLFKVLLNLLLGGYCFPRMIQLITRIKIIRFIRVISLACPAL